MTRGTLPDGRARALRSLDSLRFSRLFAALLAIGVGAPEFAHAQLSGDAGQPVQLDIPWGLRLSPQLEDHPLQAGDTPATFTIGDYLSGTADQNQKIEGHAELRRGVMVVKGDKILYDTDTDKTDAYGHVRVTNDGNSFVGPEAHLTIDSNQGYMATPHYYFNASGGSGHANQVDLLDPDTTRFMQAYYTACKCVNPANEASTVPGPDGKLPPVKPAWYIEASKLDLDSAENEGYARNAVVFFQGVPIFASPYLMFPTDDARHSGVLPPTFGSSTSGGFDLITPYYFNIAPNMDLTVYPRILSKRGEQLAGTYRYLASDYSGSFTGEFLPNDRITHTDRWAIYFQHQQSLGNGFSAYANYNRVSDGTYPQDLGSSTNFSQALSYIYQQEIGLNYSEGPWAVLARVQHWQVLPADQTAAPYEREPQLNVKYTKYNVAGFDYGVEADATNFRIATADSYQGSRLYVNPYVSYPIMTSDYYIIPKIQAHLASYNLTSIPSTAPPGQNRDPSVAIPTFSLDTGMNFERSVTIFGTDYIQTLEPRIYYVYTPFVNQNNIPIFDTADTDFGIAEVFAPNTFVGGDRVADQSRVVIGLTSRFINAASGDERARFLLAQQYFFRPQTVTLDTVAQVTPTSIDRADVIAGAQFRWGAGISTESAVDYSNSQNLLIRSVVGVAWNPADREVLNVSYRYNRANSTIDNQPINQGLISTQWPLTAHLYAVARLDYDISAKQVVDGVLGFQYDADCWAFGMGIQRYSNGFTTTGSTSSGTRVLAQLQLKGLSKIDNGLIQTFANGVQGYQNLPGSPPALSRFSNYP